MKRSQFLSMGCLIIAAPHASWEVMRWVAAIALVASWIFEWRGD
jgi:hypothetical protein